MAKENDIHCSVITPEQKVVETDATAVVIPAHDGQIGILKDRAPLLCELGMGVLRIDETGGPSREIVIDGGFAQVLDNNVIVLTEKAMPVEDVTRAEAQKALAAAEAMPNDTEDAAAERQRAIKRAHLLERVAKK